MEKEKDTSVQVAVRIRPQLASEKIEMCRICTNVIPSECQVVLGTDKAFTFDYVYDMDVMQSNIYDSCAAELVSGTFDGLNATILAYGQTGSGKTYTMGTSFDLNIEEVQVGIIPRAVAHLFGGITERRQRALDNGETPPDFKVNAQFMEIYNEEIFDLLDTTRDPTDKMRKSHIKIHEDARGGIYVVGLTTRPVNSLQDTIQCLKTGTLSRTTASTNMNAQSSRSHAIFTLHIRQQRIFKAQAMDGETEGDGAVNDSTMQHQPEIQELEMLTAKFNFVDLAGSERLKRTGATGDRAKEGISINCGLLALGNVISALGDIEKRGCHVPYRDSKLTRLLQDSLGGNSRTTMIACISPSDRDFMETLNTLKYANRARNIRNKVVVNQDLASSQLSALRAEIQALQRELGDYRMGRKVADGECVSDLFHENQTLQSENEALRQRVKALQQTVDTVTSRNAELQAEKTMFNITNGKDSFTDEDVKKVLEGYAKEVEQLRSRLTESDALVESMKASSTQLQHRSTMSSSRAFESSFSGVMTSSLDVIEDPDDHIRQILDEAKRDLMKSIKSIQHTEKSETEELESEKLTEGADGGRTGGDDGEGTDDEEDSESESENECGRLEESLADLTCEISIKQKLIDELEMSQKRLRSLKMQYEEKLNALENRIRQTEQERDRVLATIGGNDSQKEGKAKRVREEYDLKLTSMQGELKKLHAAKREHAKLMRNQTHYETQLQTLQRDLADLKKMKVKLMRQLQEEAQKTRQSELRRQKEVAQLKKQERMKDNKIRTLETDKKKKETILKRKLEEVEALRRRQKQTMSRQAAGRVSRFPRSSTSASSSHRALDDVESVDPRALKISWDNLEKLIGSIITKRQTLAHLDRDMERWIKQREIIGKKLEKFLKRQEKAMAESTDGIEPVNPELNDQIECLRDNLSYIQENINECQNCVVRLEEMRVDDVDPANILASCSFMEAVYLLEHCTSLAISKGLLAAQKDDECRELVAKLHQEQMESIFQRDMLQYLIQDKVDVEIDNGIIWQDKDVESDDDSVDSISPTDSLEVHFQGEAANLELPLRDGLLAGMETEDGLSIPVPTHLTHSLSTMSLDSLVVAPTADKTKDGKNLQEEQAPLATKENNEPSMTPSVKSNRPTGLSVASDKHPRRSPSSPSPARRPASAAAAARASASSPAIKKKDAKQSTASSPSGPLNRQSSTGVINAAVPSSMTKDFLLIHSHTAVGHSKAVLSVFASESTLYSSSKDRTAKLWDLSTGVEVLTLDGHPNNVVSVRYSEATSLVFTASAYLVKVWDARSGKSCLNTLTSAGMISDSCAIFDDVSTRPISCPPGEINVTDIALNNAGSMLYTAAGNTVRIWDLKMMRSVGKLFGGNQAAVMAMAVCDSGSTGSSCVATGSKDKCIKVFQVGRDCSGVLNPRSSLEPTHSDGIESLCIVGGTTLYSGARDMCIKSWDLTEGRLKQSITTAHRDWICGLALVPRSSSPGGGVLVSACRAGTLRTWSLTNSTFLGETQGHVGPINAICTNSTLVFTASTDRSIRLWRQRE